MSMNEGEIREIVETLEVLTIDELASLGKQIMRVANEKGAHLPWIVWEQEDFDPDGYEISLQKAEMAKNYAWQAILADRKFIDPTDSDRERVNEAIAEAVEAVSASDFLPGLTLEEADTLQRKALFSLQPWVVYEIPVYYRAPKPHWGSNWGISSDGIGMYWYDSLEEIIENHFAVGMVVPRVRLSNENFENLRTEDKRSAD
ncbi:hypothetical protein ACTXJX_11965 [Glutamicibacter ardleyensis]|uniref:hypothetical protein n=1 Tax=Glutamicibacter ardleyensis TaxID=225894 RepID=UPI003FD333CB